MADLFDRIFSTDGDGRIPVHVFQAAIVDYMAGQTSRAQIIGALALDAEATTDLDVLLAAVDALGTVQDKLRFVAEMDAVNMLAEHELKYTTKAQYRARLGL